VERPPHLKAIMPIAGTFDLYESATHHGLMSSGFITPLLYMIGMTSGRTNKLWRSKLMDAMRALLLTPSIHKKVELANGEAAIAGLKVLLNLHHDPHPWDDLWRAIAAEHPFRDAWWEDRNLHPLLGRTEIPVYIGCDWQNVPLHLPHTFTAYKRLTNSKHVQVAMMGSMASPGRGRVCTSRRLPGSSSGSRGRTQEFLTAPVSGTFCRRPRVGEAAVSGRSPKPCIVLTPCGLTELLVKTKGMRAPGCT
jgi:hypothetical protein